MNKIIYYLSNSFNIDERYIYILILSFITYFFLKGIQLILDKILIKISNSNKKQYLGVRKIHVFINIVFVFCLIILWAKDLKNFMTLITFISTAFTLALRDVIVNIFAGIYIKLKKIINLEDRIIINNIKGDVINLNSLNFEILEVNDEDHGNQSRGIVTIIPNSYVLTYPLKNYNKAFKYVWDEIQVDLPLDTDIKRAKGILYKIVNENDIIKNIPLKMEKQMALASTNYRIYYNKLRPIIYTKVTNGHIRLSIRYLIHPKKSRLVEDYIWTKILKEFKQANISLGGNI